MKRYLFILLLVLEGRMYIQNAAVPLKFHCWRTIALKSTHNYDVIVAKIVGSIFRKTLRLFSVDNLSKIASHANSDI